MTDEQAVKTGPEGKDSAAKGPKKSPARSPRIVNDPKTTTRAGGAAGVGGGTLIAILADALPDGMAKTILIWLAPAATLTLAAIWGWCSKRIAVYFYDREAEAAFRATRVAIEQALSNPNLTPDQRAELEAQRVLLDKIIVEQRMSRAVSYTKK